MEAQLASTVPAGTLKGGRAEGHGGDREGDVAGIEASDHASTEEQTAGGSKATIAAMADMELRWERQWKRHALLKQRRSRRSDAYDYLLRLAHQLIPKYLAREPLETGCHVASVQGGSRWWEEPTLLAPLSGALMPVWHAVAGEDVSLIEGEPGANEAGERATGESTSDARPRFNEQSQLHALDAIAETLASLPPDRYMRDSWLTLSVLTLNGDLPSLNSLLSSLLVARVPPAEVERWWSAETGTGRHAHEHLLIDDIEEKLEALHLGNAVGGVLLAALLLVPAAFARRRLCGHARRASSKTSLITLGAADFVSGQQAAGASSPLPAGASGLSANTAEEQVLGTGVPVGASMVCPGRIPELLQTCRGTDVAKVSTEVAQHLDDDHLLDPESFEFSSHVFELSSALGPRKGHDSKVQKGRGEVKLKGRGEVKLKAAVTGGGGRERSKKSRSTRGRSLVSQVEV